VEELAVPDVVAVDELFVAEDVAVGVQDPLREPGRAGRVVELGRIVGGGVDGLGMVVCPARSSSSSTNTSSTRSPGIRAAWSAEQTMSFACESATRWRIPSSP
jgi:hypothetical protein